MTPEDQRIAIAEACGWTWENGFNPRKQQNFLWSPDKTRRVLRWRDGSTGGNALPDYLSDLNAMHEAEKYLEREDNHSYGCYCGELMEKYGNAVSLTAPQRAEMLVQVIGKWVES